MSGISSELAPRLKFLGVFIVCICATNRFDFAVDRFHLSVVCCYCCMVVIDCCSGCIFYKLLMFFVGRHGCR